MKNLFFLPFLLLSFSLHSQDNHLKIKWEKLYGGKKNEMVNSIIPSKDGAIIVGSKQKEGRYDLDLLVFKISDEGDILWEKTFGDHKNENGYAGIELEDGSLYILGTVINKKNESDILVNKLDAQGALIWTKKYGGEYNEVAKKIIIDSNRDLVITGMQENMDATNRPISSAFILKLDLDGREKWMKNYVSGKALTLQQVSYSNAQGQGEGAETIVACKNGGYIIGGYTLTGTNKGVASDGWICKVDMEGNKIWDKSFGAIGGDLVLTIIEDEENNLVVTGTRYNKFPVFTVSLWFLKFTDAGELILEQYYNQGNECIGGNAVKLNEDRFILVGASNNTEMDWLSVDEISQEEKKQLMEKGWEIIIFNEQEYLENDNSKTGLKRINEDHYLVLVNSKGDQLSDAVLGGKEDDKLMAICSTEKGEVYAAGYTYSKGNGLKDIVIFKLE